MKLFGVILLLITFSLHSFSIVVPGDTTKANFRQKESRRLESLGKLLPSAQQEEQDPMAVTEWLTADELYQERLAALNNTTPFELQYNDRVKSFIKLYAIDRRQTTARILGLSEMYFPLFEEMLEKNDLPTELKYLAVVESALHARAKSHAAAVGLWQFIPSTGKLYGLKINSHVDERSDPIKSTLAACKYLKNLYNLFGNWELALAAYNSGPGNVNRAIRQSGGKRSYWEISDYLPRETRSYVPAFIAVNYIMRYYKEHGIKPSTADFNYTDFDTVSLSQNANLAHIAATINEPLEVLQFLNPSLKTNTIPASSQPFILTLPRDKKEVFLANNQKFRHYAEENLAEVIVKDVEDRKEARIVHKVKKGETLAAISRKYNCSVQDIKRWNKLRSTRLSLGQRLAIVKPLKGEKAASELDQQLASADPAKADLRHNKGEKADGNNIAAAKPETSAPENQKAIEDPSAKEIISVFHIVEKGDTLWSIAKKYEGITVAELKKLNNLNNTSLKPGQKLLISVGG